MLNHLPVYDQSYTDYSKEKFMIPVLGQGRRPQINRVIVNKQVVTADRETLIVSQASTMRSSDLSNLKVKYPMYEKYKSPIKFRRKEDVIQVSTSSKTETHD